MAARAQDCHGEAEAPASGLGGTPPVRRNAVTVQRGKVGEPDAETRPVVGPSAESGGTAARSQEGHGEPEAPARDLGSSPLARRNPVTVQRDKAGEPDAATRAVAAACVRCGSAVKASRRVR